jgi:peptidoglycan/xylan/chitin deacetylase (PgdA/CDA1 family)
VRAGTDIPPRSVALTFDDGYRDAVEVVSPILSSFGVSGTFFLVPELLDGSQAWWEDLASALARTAAGHFTFRDTTYALGSAMERARASAGIAGTLKGFDQARRVAEVREILRALDVDRGASNDLFMNWPECTVLQKAGHEIGSHTMSHPILARESDIAQRDELRLSKERLENYLQREVLGVAYPNGKSSDYDAVTIAAARTAGYEYGLTTRPGLDASHENAYELRRVIVDPDTNMGALLGRLFTRVSGDISRWLRR